MPLGTNGCLFRLGIALLQQLRGPEARMQGPHLYFTNLPQSLFDHMLVSSQKAPMWLPLRGTGCSRFR